MTPLESGSRPPAATVAFLFADLEGSTRLLASLGVERYREVLSGYRVLIAEAAAPEDGEVVDREGDGLFLVFPTAAGALRAAAHAQRSLARHEWPEGAAVTARMGIHAGEARRDEEGLVGLDVHRAARVASAAHGGQVLVSQAARLLALDGLPDELHLRDLGEHRLKDLNRVERLHQLVVAGIPDQFPPPVTLEAARGNLPVQTTDFVGREAELAAVVELVRPGRLATITGVGGSGKTRLTLQVAGGRAHDYRDGAWLVELGAVADPMLVDGAVLDALGISQERNVAPRAALLTGIRGWHALLVLDNCEHLLDAVATLVEAILAAEAEVAIAATSREMLGVTGEAVYGLRSMTMPKSDHRADPEALMGYDAVRLFVERAAAVQPGFRLEAHNAAAIAEICRRLDGMPLALELAAPRLRSFSVEKLAALLDQRFRLLTGGSRTALPRQQTLSAAIEWSYRLLSEAERTFFRRLSVFQGNFSYEAAVTVCAGGGVAESDVIELLPALIDKSLVTADGERAEVRYRLLESIRQFARERLDESGEVDGVRGRHAQYFLELAVQAGQHGVGPDELAWRATIDTEADNLRQAMTWLLEAGEPAEALTMAIGFARFAGWSEALAWVERALPAAWSTADRLTRARALTVRGQLLDEAGEFDRAVADLEQALEMFRQLEAEGTDRALLTQFPRYAATHISLAVVNFHGGNAGPNNEHFTEMVQEGLAVARRLEDRHSIASALGNLAHHMDPHGDPPRARRLFADAVAAARDLGSDQMLAVVSQQRALFEFDAGDLDASRDAWRTAIDHAARAGQGRDIYLLRAYLAAVEVEAGMDSAEDFVESVRALFREPSARVSAWSYQGLIVLRAGIDAAHREYERVAVAAGASASETIRGTAVRWDLARHFERVTDEARAVLGDERYEAHVERARDFDRSEIAQFLAAD